jgi:hypothetical protein
MKLHHDGFFQPQDTYLNADTGLPHAVGEIEEAEMANGDANGTPNGGFHMDVDSPPAPAEFDSEQG